MNPISSGSPVNGTGSDSCASPTSCVCAETVSSPSAKRSRSGELRCAITDDAADDVEQLLARQRHLVLERLGQQLLVVRELAVDPARRQPDVAGAEDDVVLLHAELELVPPPARSARAPSARAPGRSPRARAPRPSSSVSLTDSRYESVAAITSLPASKRTRTPVSTGRDSSRDAARADARDRAREAPRCRRVNV